MHHNTPTQLYQYLMRNPNLYRLSKNYPILGWDDQKIPQTLKECLFSVQTRPNSDKGPFKKSSLYVGFIVQQSWCSWCNFSTGKCVWLEYYINSDKNSPNLKTYCIWRVPLLSVCWWYVIRYTILFMNCPRIPLVFFESPSVLSHITPIACVSNFSWMWNTGPSSSVNLNRFKLTLTHPISLPPHTSVAQKIADKRSLDLIKGWFE